MFVMMRKMTVTEGNSDKVVEKFSEPGLLEQQEGFVDRSVMVKKTRKGDEEVLIQIRWESEELWKQWEKSDAHLAGHKAKKGQPKPDYLIGLDVSFYEVKAVKYPE